MGRAVAQSGHRRAPLQPRRVPVFRHVRGRFHAKENVFIKGKERWYFINYFFVSTTQEQYDTDEMAKEFLMSFPNQVFSVGQQLAFAFKDKKMLLLIVKDLEG